MSINPYDLLGVTIDSSLDEIKKSYYKLALLCHEDRGGNKEDMIAVHSAYNFIKKEIKNINTTITLEDIEKQFKDFCTLQTEAPPKFSDIYAEAFDLPKFNEYFDKSSEKCPSSFPGGYGEFMEQSTINPTYNDVETGSISKKFQNDLQLYKAPDEYSCGFENALDYSGVSPTDFTTTTNGLAMSDYKEAYSGVITDSNVVMSNRTYESLLLERNNTDIINPDIKSDYTWSSSGMLDNSGNRIKDYLKLI
jgi:hypothetical protein